MARTLMVLLVAFLAVGLTACFDGTPEVVPEDQVAADDRPDETAEGDGEAAGDGDIADTATFVAIDNEYTEFPEEVAAGAVEFTLVNEGAADHNVVITEPNEIEVVGTIAGGETETNVVELEPGTYDYICTIPGHEATMNGTLEVTG